MINTATLRRALPWLLSPVVRLCLRYGVSLNDVEHAVKRVFALEARELLRANRQPVNESRISAMTGMQRPLIKKILADDRPDDAGRSMSLLTKVLGAWQTKREFTTKNGAPRTLSAEGKSSEFARLVKSVSSALNPYTVLKELERAGLVERSGRGIKPSMASFVVREDVETGLRFLGADISDLARCVEENLRGEGTPANHHLTTAFDNIPRSKAQELRTFLLHEGHRLHARIRQFLGSHDRDISGTGGGADAIRVSFTSFGAIEPSRKEGGKI